MQPEFSIQRYFAIVVYAKVTARTAHAKATQVLLQARAAAKGLYEGICHVTQLNHRRYPPVFPCARYIARKVVSHKTSIPPVCALGSQRRRRKTDLRFRSRQEYSREKNRDDADVISPLHASVSHVPPLVVCDWRQNESIPQSS